jgi:hypothetical protein
VVAPKFGPFEPFASIYLAHIGPFPPVAVGNDSLTVVPVDDLAHRFGQLITVPVDVDVRRYLDRRVPKELLHRFEVPGDVKDALAGRWEEGGASRSNRRASRTRASVPSARRPALPNERRRRLKVEQSRRPREVRTGR